jgi:hypothetical protein
MVLIYWINISFLCKLHNSRNHSLHGKTLGRNISEESYTKLFEVTILPSIGNQNYFLFWCVRETISRWN